MNAIQTPLSSNSLLIANTPFKRITPTLTSSSVSSFTRKNSIKSSLQTYPETPTYKKHTVPSSLYQVLQVSRTATPGQIKSAYRTLAKTYHPDASNLHSSNGQDFIEINKAYLTLSDPASRALYDMKLGFAGSFSQPGRVEGSSGYYYPAVRRWETDQCW